MKRQWDFDPDAVDVDMVGAVKKWVAEVKKAKEKQDEEVGETGEEWVQAWDDVKGGSSGFGTFARPGLRKLGICWRGVSGNVWRNRCAGIGQVRLW